MAYEKQIKIYPLHIGDVYNKAQFEYIDNKLEAKQKFVGGTIQCVPIDMERKLDIICNDDGKLLGLTPNCAWVIDGMVADVIVGEALICRHDDEGNFCSIHDEDKDFILDIFKRIIAISNGKFCVIDKAGNLELLEVYK